MINPTPRPLYPGERDPSTVFDKISIQFDAEIFARNTTSDLSTVRTLNRKPVGC